MNISKMDHAMLSFGLMGSLLVPRPETVKRRSLFAILFKRTAPSRPR